MSTSRQKPRLARRPRRIIERPRLIKLLDGAEARVILLLAPAGYGKTTLARQWVTTLSGAIWVSATPSHRDVVTFSQDIATGIDALGGNASGFIAEYLRARSNPQRAGREVASALADRIEEARVQWLVLDDYQELAKSAEVEEMVDAFQRLTTIRLLVASRLRPRWATSRRVLYGEIAEINRELLAMDPDEALTLLGRQSELKGLVSQAEGWPAVLGLAAGIDQAAAPDGALPDALHTYLADELFQLASEELQHQLVALALIPQMTQDAIDKRFGGRGKVIVAQARELGFLSAGPRLELHPLIREFLLQKATDDPLPEDVVRAAVAECIAAECWDRALEIVHRFNLLDMVESILDAAYKPLVRSGRLGSLSEFARGIRRSAPSSAPPAVDLIEAEIALRDGMFGLATDLATRASKRLPDEHPLKSHAHAIIGQCTSDGVDPVRAATAFKVAYACASDDRDAADALYGLALASAQSERDDSEWVFAKLSERRHNSAVDLLRWNNAELSRRRFSEGLAAPLELEGPLHRFDEAEDPLARSSFAFNASYSLAIRAEYRTALEIAALLLAEVDAYRLAFARPHAHWNIALIKLGLRRFGEAEKSLQIVEDEVRERPSGHHELNARILRARLALETGQPEEALRFVKRPDSEAAFPSLHAEYLATRSLVLAATGELDAAAETLGDSEELSRAVEVRVLFQATRSIIAACTGDATGVPRIAELAAELGAWDPLVAAVRSSTTLADALAQVDDIRPHLETLYQRSNDLGLARRAGFRARARSAPNEILSPRELEVLGLMSRGLRNREIAQALFIAESTVKVHVRHVLEKLGVRTRTEAVRRLEMYSDSG